jgi:hypothetical protein
MLPLFSNTADVATSIITLSTVGFIVFLAIPSFLQAGLKFSDEELLKRGAVKNPHFTVMEKIVILINLDIHGRNFVKISGCFLLSGFFSLIFLATKWPLFILLSYIVIVLTLLFSLYNIINVYGESKDSSLVIRRFYVQHILLEFSQTPRSRNVT